MAMSPCLRCELLAVVHVKYLMSREAKEEAKKGMYQNQIRIPLLHGQRLILLNTEPDHLALSVEGIEIHMRNDSKGTTRRRHCQLRQLPVCKSRLPPSRLAAGHWR